MLCTCVSLDKCTDAELEYIIRFVYSDTLVILYGLCRLLVNSGVGDYGMFVVCPCHDNGLPNDIANSINELIHFLYLYFPNR